MAHHQGVLGELLEEALGCCHVDVEIESPGHGGQGEEGEKRPHFAGDLAGHLVLLVTVKGGDGVHSDEVLEIDTSRCNTGWHSVAPGQAFKAATFRKIRPTQGIGQITCSLCESRPINFCRHATPGWDFLAVFAAKIHQKRP